MKRANEQTAPSKSTKTELSSAPNAPVSNPVNEDQMGEFEDPYGDEFESESDVFEAGENGEQDMDDDAPKEDNTSSQRVYIPSRSAPLGPDEQMEPDMSTYIFLHNFTVRWPSLSFSVANDDLGPNRTKFPHSLFLVSGTQASQANKNEVNVVKLSQLGKTQATDSDMESDDEDDVHYDPMLESRDLNVQSTVNRIRLSSCNNGQERMVASMHESGDIMLFDVQNHIKSLGRAGFQWSKKPIHVVKSHKRTEGYALDWSPLQANTLLTGDCEGKIFLTTKQRQWETDPNPFVNPSGSSIEEIQFSPVEKQVFASTGSDGHLRIWNLEQKAPLISVKIADCDVNVMSWNRKAPHLLATGHDDGQICVWDLRTFQKGVPVAKFDFHTKPITSIEWNPLDETCLLACCEDSTVSVWDLSVESDDSEVQRAKDLENVPAQLLFLHWQPNAKEAHWHPQIPGCVISTGSDGFAVWRSISV